MKVTVAKALKLKNRITQKIQEVSGSIQSYNSIIEGKDRPVDVNVQMQKRDKLTEALINLKTAINQANMPIQSTVYLLAELKGELGFLRGIDTTSGKQVSTANWGGEDKIYSKSCVIDYKTLNNLIHQAEVDIDANQDTLDTHNHTVMIDVDQEVLDLIKG